MKNNIVIDLFAGAGGFSLGAHKAGYEVQYAFDYDADLTYSLKTNFQKTRVVNKDLFSYSPQQLLKEAGYKKGEIAGILGGPPCQGFSYIGKRDPNDPRNKLVTNFFKFVNEIQPRFFVMENVPGLLTGKFDQLLERGLDLVSSKYELLPNMILNASDFGAATSRKRLFIIGYLTDYIDTISVEDIESGNNKPPSTVYDAIADLPTIKSAKLNGNGDYWAKFQVNAKSEYAFAARKIPSKGFSSEFVKMLLKEGFVSGFQPTQHTQKVKRRFSTVPPGGKDAVSRSRRLDWDGFCPSLRAGTGKDHGSFQALRPIHPEEDRVISVREAARLQGFPDWFQFHPTKWHSFRMIGNSVSPYISEAILSVVARNSGVTK